jgi:general secretion pathway protein L
VNSALLVKQCGTDNYQWHRVGGDAQDVLTGDSEALAQSCLPDKELILIAPTQDVSMREVGFEAHEKKMLRQTIPYSLEDDLLEDVGELHFALGEVKKERVPVAWIKKEQLQQWLNTLQDQSLEGRQVLPELMLLPREDNSWILLIDDDRWLVKSAKYQGFSLEADNAGLALQLLLDEAEELPESFVVYAGQADHDDILSKLPEMLRGIVEWREEDYWQLIATACNDDIQPTVKQLDLLQGAYERKLPWLKWWQTWKIAAIFLAVVTVVQFVAGYSEVSSRENTNLSLRQEIERAYRSVVPRGAVVNPTKQLKRKVRALEGGGGGGFVPLLDKIAQVVAKSTGLKVHSLNYTEKQSEVRLTILAPSFDDVETARTEMEKLGLKAELTGSSSENGKTRARLRIKG